MHEPDAAATQAPITAPAAPTAFQMKAKSQVKAALEYVGADSSDASIETAFAGGIHALAELTIMTHYRTMAGAGAAGQPVAMTLGELFDWYAKTDCANDIVNGMTALARHDPAHLLKILSAPEGVDLEHAFDIEGMVKCYQIIGLSEADSRQLVGEMAYFANKFSEQISDVFTAKFCEQLFSGLMDDFMENIEELEQAGDIRRFGLAKSIMGEYMIDSVEATESSLWSLGLVPADGKLI